MRKEQLANIISYLESIKEKDGDYKKYIESLDLLASRLLSYYTPNIQGKYMDITKEEYDELDNLFKDAIQKSEFFKSTKFADEKNEIARDVKNNINEKLHKEFLTDFYADFKHVDINSGKSFYEEMQKNKKVVVQVENEPIIDNQPVEEVKEEKKEEKKEEAKEDNGRSVGDISASNIYMDGLFQKDKMTVTYQNEKISGTFIYKTNYDPDKQIDDLLREYKNKYPEYAEYFSSLKDIEKLNELASIKNSEILDDSDNINNFLAGKNLKLAEFANFNKLVNNPNFINANADFILKLRPVLKEVNDYSVELKATAETNLDRRNVAVTGLANMLDEKKVIPNARAVAIEKDDGEHKYYIEGTFIEDPKGKTIDEFKLDDKVHTLGIDAWNTVEAKKAIANLQVIDYICGRKRDINNIKFEFDPKTNKLVGVQGINNEKSFFAPNPKPIIIGEEDYSDIENIKVIDSEMATKISAIEEPEFKALMVQYGLSETEVEEAWNRLYDLKRVISDPKILDEKDDPNKLFKEEKFIIVNGDDAWNNLSLNELKAKDNIFNKVIEAQNKLVSAAKADKSLDENYKILKHTYDKKLIEGDLFLEEARKHAPLFGTSRRYSNILKGLAEYNNAQTPEEKASKLDNLQSLVDLYEADKIKDGTITQNGNLIKNLSGKDLGRVNVVLKLNEFIGNVRQLGNEVEDANNKRNDDFKRVDEFNSTYRLGKYKNYAKVYTNEKGQIKINANILEREKQINNILTETNKKMILANNGVDLDKSPAQKEKYEVYKNYIDSTITNCKEQLLNDYHHGAIPKEYFEYKMNKYDNKIFDFEEEENKFSYENPESEIFKNSFQEEINNALKKDNVEEEMKELEDFSNKVDLEINEEQIEAK